MQRIDWDKKILNILPLYSVIPLAASLLFNFFTYFCTRPLTNLLPHYDISIGLDYKIPFIPAWMIIYVLAFPIWALGYIMIGREDRDTVFRIMTAELIAKFICLIFFFAMPTAMPADLTVTHISGHGFIGFLSNIVYGADQPNNLFPSIHCLESWMIFRATFSCKRLFKSKTAVVSYQIFLFVAAILVFASTVLVNQHLFLDIIGGIVVVEIGLIVSKKLRTGRIYHALMRKLEKHEE